jgi:hypothetical protein
VRGDLLAAVGATVQPAGQACGCVVPAVTIPLR